jgi:hypothetical protein
VVNKYADYHDAPVLEVLRRHGGGPVSLDQVTALFVELPQHEDGCVCGKCDWVQAAQPDKVLRAAQCWSRCGPDCWKGPTAMHRRIAASPD